MAIERFPIEAGHVMMFARAIGDQNPVYADESVAARSEVGAIPAPPTFVTASAQFDPDYPLRPNPGVEWFGSGAGPGTDDPRGAGVLHAEQHFEYHRPLRPGDVLRADTRAGETWEKHGRSGRLVFREQITDYFDQDGDLVVSARSVSVVTERPGE